MLPGLLMTSLRARVRTEYLPLTKGDISIYLHDLYCHGIVLPAGDGAFSPDAGP